MKKISLVLVVIILAVSVGLGIALVQKELDAQKGKGDKEIPFTNYEVDYFDEATRVDSKNGIRINFNKETTFNTVVLKESGDVIREFSLFYTDKEGNDKFIYKQDLVEGYRYCSFPTISTTSLYVEIKGVEGEAWNINDIEIYNEN